MNGEVVGLNAGGSSWTECRGQHLDLIQGAVGGLNAGAAVGLNAGTVVGLHSGGSRWTESRGCE